MAEMPHNCQRTIFGFIRSCLPKTSEVILPTGEWKFRSSTNGFTFVPGDWGIGWQVGSRTLIWVEDCCQQSMFWISLLWFNKLVLLHSSHPYHQLPQSLAMVITGQGPVAARLTVAHKGYHDLLHLELFFDAP